MIFSSLIFMIGVSATIIYSIKAANEYFSPPRPIKFLTFSSKSGITVEEFLAKLNSNSGSIEEAAISESINTSGVSDEKPGPVNIQALFDQFFPKLWESFSDYQKSCNISPPITKEVFFKKFPKSIIRQRLQDYGDSFALSQDAFSKTVVSNSEIIKLCRAEGAMGVKLFLRSLDWHTVEWKKRVIEEKIFHRNEAERVRLAKIQEDVRISTKKSNALMSLKMALISFGITTGIVFLFLLVRIERNLRRLLTTPS